MSATFVNPTVVAKEALMQLENNCVMGNLVNRSYEKEFMQKNNGWKIGDTLTIRAPMYARVQDGATIKVVDILQQSTTVTLEYRKHVAHRLTGAEMTYNIDGWNEEIIKPAMVALGNYIDLSILGQYAYIPNQVGTPGATPSDLLVYDTAMDRLTDQGVPLDNRSIVVNPTARTYLSSHIKGLFLPNKVKNAVEAASLGALSGANWYVTQNVNRHTTGTASGSSSVLVNDTVAEEDTTINIDTNGSWTLTLTAGDIFTIAGVNACNPISGADLGYLRQFVCLSHTDNGNDATLTCIPGTAPWKMRSASATDKYLPYQNMVALPANNAAVTVAGGAASVTHPVNLGFHKDAITLCMVPLHMPESAGWKAQESANGFTVRVVKGYDIENDYEYIRFDVLFALKTINPFMGCRIAG